MASGSKIKECIKCGKSYKIDMFPYTNSKFFLNHRADLCMNCIEELIDGEVIEDIDRVCRWLDYPLLIADWMELYKVHREKTFRHYSQMFAEGRYPEFDWKDTNEKLKMAVGDGTLNELVPELNQQWLDEMHEKWQFDGSAEEFKHLEFLHKELLRTQNIVTGTQADSALKMCKLSLLADREIRKGDSPKDLIKTYQELAKAADFTPKNAKNAGDFDSVGELFLWLEKRGWQRKFYDFEVKDEIDKTVANIQNYLRRLVLGESNLTVEVEKRLQGLKSFEIDDADDFDFDAQAREEADALNFDEVPEEFEV